MDKNIYSAVVKYLELIKEVFNQVKIINIF
jgi:hypothetical protein